MAQSLERLTVRNGLLTDGEGRSVTLRGMVTITADHRGPVELDEKNFDQLASFGFNVQQIRLEGARLGVLETEADPRYLDKLDRWVTWGAERGIYAIFKMTTYDVPSIGGPGNAFNRDIWQQFWDRDEWRSNRIDAWRRVWERFAGRSEVVGYDILNEPFIGNDTPDINKSRLYPFYQHAGDELQKVDAEKCLIVQPVAGGQWAGLEGSTPHGTQERLDHPSVVFAPHFYPDLTVELSVAEYEAELEGFQTEAEQVGGALIIGEFGNPNESFIPRFRSCDPKEERIKGDVFDRFGVGAIRPWYIDNGLWAVLGPGFTDSERLDAIVRPFPARVPGQATWSFDDASSRLEVEIDPADGSEAELVINVPERYYGDSARVRVGDDAAAGTTANNGSIRLRLPSKSGRVTVVVEP